MKLKNKVIFITGASRGIGKAAALEFAKEGSKIVIAYYNNKKEAEKVQGECKKAGASDVFVVQLDVMDEKSIKKAAGKVIDKFGHISVLINNAGVIRWKEFTKQTIDDIRVQIRTNLEGLLVMTKICFPYIKDMIINIGSGAGKHAHETLSTYCATKWGVIGFTRTLALETKLKVYCVNPDMTQTDMTDFQGRSVEEVAKVILDTAKGKYKGVDVDVWDVV